MNAACFEEIVRRRRSNRKFQPGVSVPDEVITRCLKNSLLSPNSSNMQLWEFYVIKDAALKERFHYYCMRQSAARTADKLVVFVTRGDLWKTHAQWNAANVKRDIKGTPTLLQKRGINYYQKLMPFIYINDGLGIFDLMRRLFSYAVGLTKPIVRLYGGTGRKVMLHKSCALAAQTFMLSVAAEDYDTCPMEGFDSVRVRKELGLPRGAEINMIVAVGKGTSEGIYGNQYRLPYEQVVFER